MANDDDQPTRLRAFDLTNVAARKSDEVDHDDGAVDEDDEPQSDEPGRTR